jgi:carbonic anhydrase
LRFVDVVARTNVQMTVSNIQKNSPVPAELESKGTIKIVGAMYNLQTAAVEFLS